MTDDFSDLPDFSEFDFSEPSEPRPTPPRRTRRSRRRRNTPSRRFWGLLLFLVLLGLAAWQLPRRFSAIYHATATPSPTASPAPTATATPTVTPSPMPAGTPMPTPVSLQYPNGLTVLSLQDGLYSQLFAYNPQGLPLTRLTADATDHITPALSPDGQTLAYAARTAQGWDLFLLSLQDGQATPITHDAAYDAAPSWSPDGLWLAYEHYENQNLDIFIRDRNGEQAPIRLTMHPAADYAPAWAPQGRLVAFVSTREGTPQIFIANLDKPENERFTRLSQPEQGPARHPTWSADGRYLAWSQTTNGMPTLYVWDAAHPDRLPRAIGMGWWPQWSPDGLLAAVVRLPNQDALTAYDPERGLALPLMDLPGTVTGFTVGNAALPWPLPAAFQQAASITPTPKWTPLANPNGPNGRLDVVPLPKVKAPYPKLSDAADEAFAALRQALAQKAGWDVLGTLDNAYVPLTAPLPEGLGQDWLYTGRAFALPTTPIQAGWMVVVREDIAPYTYWRVYVRAAKQDGTQGQPLHDLPWDFNARFSGDITAFEQGGAYAPAVPPGYWVDVTALALAFGWERLPALPDWRAYLPGARFNEFVLRQGLTWQQAMEQIYPQDAILTPTPHPTANIPIVPPTPTP
ncbi:MAG: hypothetical protein GXO56_07645 [Chloroflexi bacterium]|nr:hypothetical protein [Chloroflexota bacterium]